MSKNFKAIPTNHCAYCEASLTVWNVQTCAHCGKKICSDHAQIRRSPFSRVLYSVCPQCSDITTPRTHASKKTTKARTATTV